MLYSSYMTKDAKRQGFTLVELVVTITIIALLASLAVVSYATWRKETTATKVKSDLLNAQTAIEDYRNFNAGYPANLTDVYKGSSRIVLTYLPNQCIEAHSLDQPDMKFKVRIDSVNQDIQEGSCIGL